ncbi:hypothetical protein D3C84_605780 [compost metagenome]
MVGQVRQDRQVLRLGFSQLCRRQGQHATEHEEQHHHHHQAMGAAKDLRAAGFGLFAIAALLVYREGRNDRRVVERKHHHRNRQPQGVQQRRWLRDGGCRGQNAAVPVRDQEHRQKQQGNDKGIDHQAHGLDDRLLTATHHRQQT